MQTSLSSSLVVLLSLLIVIVLTITSSSTSSSSVVSAQATCSGACSNTSLFLPGNYSNFTNISTCTEVAFNLTTVSSASTPTTLIGTSIYHVDSNVELAAMHSGFANNGDTNIPLFAYFAGQKTAFWSSTRNGIKSSLSVAATNDTFAGYGFYLSNVSGQCLNGVGEPTVTPLAYPLSAHEQGIALSSTTCSYDSTAKTGVIGSGAYHQQSDVSCVLDLEGVTSLTKNSSSTYYLYDVGFRNTFLATAMLSTEKGTMKTGHAFPSSSSEASLTTTTNRAFILSTSYDATTLSNNYYFQDQNSTYAVQVDLTQEASLLAAVNAAGGASTATAIALLGASGRLYGTNPFYTADSSVAAAAWHAGCAIPGTVQTCYITPQPYATRFYSSGMNSVESEYFNTENASSPTFTAKRYMGGFSVSARRESAPTLNSGYSFGETSTPNGDTTIAFLPMDRVIRSPLVLVGSSVYTFNSDIQKAAFHSSVRSVYQSGSVYIHEVPSAVAPPMLFSVERQGLKSQGLSIAQQAAQNNLLITITSSSERTRPTMSKNETVITVQPKFYHSDKVVGAGYYSLDESDLLSCALHTGLVTFGERKTLYITFIGQKNFFYKATNGPFASRSSSSTTSQAFVITDYSTGGHFPNNVYPVYLSATDLPNLRPTIGTTYYHKTSDLTGVAVHQRLIQWQQTAVRLWIHEDNRVNKRVFLSSTSNQVQSEYRFFSTTNQSSVMISTSSTPIASSSLPQDPSFIASTGVGLKISVQHEVLLPGNGRAVGGARVYQASSTDLRVAAVIDDLITLHETKDLYVHWIPTLSPSVVPCFPSTSNLLSSSNSSSSSLSGPFFILSESALSSSVASDISLLLNNGIFRTRVVFSPSKNRKKLVGTHYYRYDSDIATAAVHAGVVDGVSQSDIWQTVYVHISGTVPYFFASGGSQSTGYIFSESSDQSACSFRVSKTATALPAMNFTNFGPLSITPQYFAPIYGTNYYSLDSEIGTVALHQKLLKYNETNNNVYVKVLATRRSVFYSSTMNDVSSLGRYFSTPNAQRAFVLSLDASPLVSGDSLVPASSNAMPVRLRMLNIPRIPQTDASSTVLLSTTNPMPPPVSNSPSGNDDDSDFLFYRKLPQSTCIGAGYYDVTSDLTLAAVHNGLLRVGELKTLYVHLFPGRTAFVGAESRGIFCLGRKGNANATIILSTSPTTPSWYLGTNVQVANISARQKSCPEDDGGSNAPKIENPYPQLFGFGRYDLDGTASGDLAAVASGHAVRGVPTQVYFWTFPSDLGFVPAGTGLSGISSRAKFVSSFTPPFFIEPLSTFEVTSTPTAPSAVTSFTVLGVTVNWPGYDALPNLNVWGVGGAYHFESDVVGAAIHAGLLTSNSGPVKVWIHFSKAPLQSFIGATSFGVTSKHCVDCYASYFVITNSSSPSPSAPAVRSAELKWTSVEHAVNATHNFFGCYPYQVDAAYAALKEGLIPSPDPSTGGLSSRTVYFHEFSGKYTPGVATGPTSCYIPSLSSSPPTSRAIPLKVFGSGPVSHLQAPKRERRLIGTDRYSLASDVYLAAFHLGLINDGEERTLYLHVSDINYEHFFASTRNGISSTSDFSQSQRAFTLTASPVPAGFEPDDSPFEFTLNSPWTEASVNGVTGTGIYTMSSDITFAAAHAGLFRFSSDKTRTYTIYVHASGTRQVYLSSVFDGVRSEYLNDGQDHAAMIMSAAATPLQACTTESTDTFYAPLRGANPIDGVSQLSVLSDGISFSGNSDIARGAAYTNLVAPYTLRYVKVVMTFYSGAGVAFPNINTGSNSITPTTNPANNVSFQISPDTTCTVPGWPTEISSLPLTPNCQGSCALTLFPLGPGTPLGTIRTVTVAADSLSTGTGEAKLDGTGAYSLWSDIQKAVVHAGLLYPGEIAQVSMVYVGQKKILGSSMRGVTSYGAGGTTRYPAIGIYLSATGGSFSYDADVIGPVNMSFSQFGLFRNMSNLKGSRIYKQEANADAVAAAYHFFAVSENGTYTSEKTVYIHNPNQQTMFLSATVGSGCTQGENITAQMNSLEPSSAAFAFSTSASSATIPSNLTTKIRFPPVSLWTQSTSFFPFSSTSSSSSSNNNQQHHVGAGVYPYTGDLVVAAVQSGYLTEIHQSIELNVTDVGVVGSFWGHFSRGVLTVGVNNSVTKLGGIVLSTNRSAVNFTSTIIYNVTELVPMNITTTTSNETTSNISSTSSSTTTSTSTTTTVTTSDPNSTATTNANSSLSTVVSSSTTAEPTTTTMATPAPPTIVYVNVTRTLSETVQLLPIKIDFSDVPEAIRVGAQVYGTPEAYSPTSNMLLAAAHSADPAFFLEQVNTPADQKTEILTALALDYFPRAVIHSQRRNSIISRALAATSLGDTLDTVRVEFRLPSQPYSDFHGSFVSEIDLGGSLLEVATNVSRADQGGDTWLYGTGVYSSDSEIALAAAHFSAGLTNAEKSQITKICAHAAPPQSRSENAIPGAVGPSGIRSCSTTVIDVANSTANAGRFTISFGSCTDAAASANSSSIVTKTPVVSPTATKIAFNLTTSSLLDFDYSTVCFGFQFFGGDVKRSVYTKYYQSTTSSSIANTNALVSEGNAYKTVYIVPLGDSPALPTSSSIGCAAFAGNLSSSSVVPSYFVTTNESENFNAATTIVRGSIASGNYSVRVPNVGLDEFASTLYFSNSGSVCKGDSIYTVDTDVLCSAYRHGIVNFGDSGKEIVVDVQTLPSTSSGTVSMFGTWRRGQRSVFSGDYSSVGANYVTCMSTRLASSTIQTCQENYQKFENLCLQPIHYLRQRNQAVGTNPFSSNSDALLAAVAVGAVNTTYSSTQQNCITSFVLSSTTTAQPSFVGGSKGDIVQVRSSAFSCASTSNNAAVNPQPLCSAIPAFEISDIVLDTASMSSTSALSNTGISSGTGSTNNNGTKVTVRCEFEESSLERAAGLTLWSPSTDLGVIAVMQFGCNWSSSIDLFVSYIPVPPQMPYFISTCAFGVCGKLGLSTAFETHLMLVTQSEEDTFEITNSLANTSYPVNISNNVAQLIDHVNKTASVSIESGTFLPITGAGRYTMETSFVSLAAIFEGYSHLPLTTSSSITQRTMELMNGDSNNRMIKTYLGHSTVQPLYLSTSRLGFETQFRNSTTASASFSFVSSPGLLPEGNSTDFTTNIAHNNQVPARYYYTLNASNGNQITRSSLASSVLAGLGKYEKALWSIPIAAAHSGIMDTRLTTELATTIWIRSIHDGTGIFDLPFLPGTTARGITTRTLTSASPMPLRWQLQANWFFMSLNSGEYQPRVKLQPEYGIDKTITGTGDYAISSPISMALVHAGIAEVDDNRFQVPVEIYNVATPRSMLLASQYGDMISQLSVFPNNTQVYMLHEMTIVPDCRRPTAVPTSGTTITASINKNNQAFGTNDWLVVDVRSASTGQLGTNRVVGPASLPSDANSTVNANFWYRPSLVSSSVVQTGFVNRGGAIARINISFGPALVGTVFPATLLNTMQSGTATLTVNNETAYTIVNASDCEFVSQSMSQTLSFTKSHEPTESESDNITDTRSLPPTPTHTGSRTTFSVTPYTNTKTFSHTRTASPSLSSRNVSKTRSSTIKSRTRTYSPIVVVPFKIPEFAIGDHLATPILWAAGPTSILAMLFGGSPVNGLYSTSALAVAEFSLCYRDNINGSLRFPESAWPGFTIGRADGQHIRGAIVANMCTMIALGMIILAFGAFKARVRKFSNNKKNRKQAKRAGLQAVSSGNFASSASFAGALSVGSFPGAPVPVEDPEADDRDFFDRAFQEAWYPGSYILCSSLFLEGIVVSVTKLLINGPDVLDVVLCCLGIIMVMQLTVVAWTVVSRSFHANASVRFCASYVRVMDEKNHESVIVRFLRSSFSATVFIGHYCWCAKKNTEDSENNVMPGPAKPAGLLVLPFRARNQNEGAIIALAMRYFFVECIVALIIGIARGIQDPCDVMMWIVAAATFIALLLQIYVRPYNIPFYNTTAAWTNAGITTAAFCIAAYHNGFGGEDVRLVGEIMAMMAALGGSVPFLNYFIRQSLLWSVTADVAPIGLQDEKTRLKALAEKQKNKLSPRSISSGENNDDDDGNNNNMGNELSFGANNNQSENAGKASPSSHVTNAVDHNGDGPDEFELADMVAQKQPVNWPLKPKSEIRLPPLQHFETTDDDLFLRKKGEYRHQEAIFHDAEERRKIEERAREKEIEDQREKERQEKLQQEAQKIQDKLAERDRLEKEKNGHGGGRRKSSAAAYDPSSPRSAAGVTPLSTPPEDKGHLSHPLLSPSPGRNTHQFAVVIDQNSNNKNNSNNNNNNDDFDEFDERSYGNTNNNNNNNNNGEAPSIIVGNKHNEGDYSPPSHSLGSTLAGIGNNNNNNNTPSPMLPLREGSTNNNNKKSAVDEFDDLFANDSPKHNNSKHVDELMSELNNVQVKTVPVPTNNNQQHPKSNYHSAPQESKDELDFL